MGNKILFISHEASHTGAPIVLLHLLRWIKQNTDLQFEVLVKIDGPLTPKFQELAKTHVLYKPCSRHESYLKRFLERGYVFFINRVREMVIIPILKSRGFTIIYSNTITNGKLTYQLKKSLKCRVITHVHELKAGIDHFGLVNLNKVLESTDHFITVSDAVRENIVTNYQVPKAKTSLIYAFICSKSLATFRRSQMRKVVLQELGIPAEDCFLIGGSGTVEWRKGYDAFLLIAHEVINRKLSDKIYFIWLGGNTDEPVFRQIQFDLENMDIADKVKFVGSRNPVAQYFNELDLFFLTSREDPYPLVCLENAALGNPVLCFEKAGGMPEFVQQDCGNIIPYLNIRKAADAIEELYKDPTLLAAKGKNAQKKVNKQHDVDIAVPLIVDIINNKNHLKGS